VKAPRFDDGWPKMTYRDREQAETMAARWSAAGEEFLVLTAEDAACLEGCE
jgi:hypothetical protein